jgi:hypothetical protein
MIPLERTADDQSEIANLESFFNVHDVSGSEPSARAKEMALRIEHIVRSGEQSTVAGSPQLTLPSTSPKERKGKYPRSGAPSFLSRPNTADASEIDDAGKRITDPGSYVMRRPVTAQEVQDARNPEPLTMMPSLFQRSPALDSPRPDTHYHYFRQQLPGTSPQHRRIMAWKSEVIRRSFKYNAPKGQSGRFDTYTSSEADDWEEGGIAWPNPRAEDVCPVMPCLASRYLQSRPNTAYSSSCVA